MGGWGGTARRRLLAAALLLLPVPAARGQEPSGSAPAPLALAQGERLTVAHEIRLAPPRVEELSAAGPTVALGGYRPGGIRHLPPVVPVITRELPNLWELELEDEEALEDIEVRLVIEDLSGRRGRLAPTDSTKGAVTVRIYSTRPEVVRHAPGSVVVRGGAVLELDLCRARGRGPYRGVLRVTLERR